MCKQTANAESLTQKTAQRVPRKRTQRTQRCQRTRSALTSFRFA